MGNCGTRSQEEEPLAQTKLQDYITKQQHEDTVHSLEQEIKAIKNQLMSKLEHDIHSLKEQQANLDDGVKRLVETVKKREGIDIDQIGKLHVVSSNKGGEIMTEEIETLRKNLQTLFTQQEELKKALKNKTEQDEMKTQIQSLRDELSLMNDRIKQLSQQIDSKFNQTTAGPMPKSIEDNMLGPEKDATKTTVISQKHGTPSTEDINCVVVGDRGIGKEMLLETFATRMASQQGTEKDEAVNGRYLFRSPYKDQSKNLSLLSISGEEAYKKRRKLCYWEANVFLVCYSVSDRVTFNNVGEEWIKEIKQFCAENRLGNIPIVIVGIQSGRRVQGGSSVTRKEGEQLAARESAAGYIECATDQKSISRLFNEAYNVALSPHTEFSCVLVGDPAVGKEGLLQNYAAQLDQNQYEVVNGRYFFPFQNQSSTRYVSLLSISGEEGNKKRRQLCYWGAEVYLVCFSVVNKDSFQHAEQTWIPEIKSFCSENKHDMIIIIIGTEVNKRKPGVEYVTEEQGKQLAERTSAVGYIECTNDQAGAVKLITEICHLYQKTKCK